MSLHRTRATARFPAIAALAAIAALIGALSAAGGARADGLADEAELHFQRGAAAYSRGDFDAALEHFLVSNRLVPNRNVGYNIARAFEKMGRYADAHRYYADALTGETDAQALKDVRDALDRISPKVAVLEVSTTPPGATIYLERKDLGSRGRSPRPLAVAPGRYQIIAELEGYTPVSSELIQADLGRSTAVSLTLQRIEGTVHVDIEGAPSAAVRADDERSPPLCNAPCDAKLPPGPHELYFSREGFHAPSRRVTVVARQTVKAMASLSPFTGSLLVTAEESGALVSINGKSMGFTPAAILNVAAGPQKVRVSLRGYLPIEREVVVVPGQETKLQNLALEPVRQVTAVSRYAEQLDDAPSSVSILDHQELSAFAYPTIAEALRGVRGIYLSNDRVYFSAGIRGLGQPNDYGNRVLLLSDGQPLNDNLLNSSYIGSDGRADLGDIDRIEVVRGPGSLLYGTGALSGVINLVTRPRDEPNGVHVGIGAYDNAVTRARLGFHYNFSPSAGIWASVSGARSSGVNVDVPLKDLPPGSPTTQTAHGADAFGAGGTAGRAWWGPVTVQWFYHQRVQSTPIGSYATTFDDPSSSSRDTRMMAELRYEPQLSKSFQLMTRAHANRYFFNGSYSFAPEHNVETFVGTWFGAEARLVYNPSAALRITAGGEAQADIEATIQGRKEGAGAAVSYLDEKRPYRFGAGYALIEGSPLPWLRVSGGARVDVYSTFGPIVVPRAAVIVKPTQGGTLKLMGGRAFRAPSIYELHYSDNGESQLPAGDLLPESVYSGEVEYSQRFQEDWIALGAVHLSYLEHLISTYPVSAGSPLVSYQNSPAPALAAGGDLELRREWRKGFLLSASYSYQYARFLDAPQGNPRLPAAPEHLASLKGVVPIVPELLSAGLRMVLEAPRRIDSEHADLTQTAVVADATVSGFIRPAFLRYTLGVYNLADVRYALPVTPTFLSRTMPQNGRTFLFDLLATYP